MKKSRNVFQKIQSIKNTLFLAVFYLKNPQTLVGSIEFLYFYFLKENSESLAFKVLDSYSHKNYPKRFKS